MRKGEMVRHCIPRVIVASLNLNDCASSPVWAPVGIEFHKHLRI